MKLKFLSFIFKVYFGINRKYLQIKYITITRALILIALIQIF